MQAFFEAIGYIGLGMLALTGLLAGLIATKVSGGGQAARNMIVGVIGALAIPVILTGLGVGVIVAGGLAAMLIAALIGAVFVILIARMVFD
jgi:uncharacterized membrane protein YeaQ/YmgE (transglycosylase-associated protein family)